MRKLLIVAVILITFNTCQSHADSKKSNDNDYGLNLEEFSVDYARYKDGSRDPAIYPYTPHERLDVVGNLSALKYLYLNNTIHSETDSQQFRLIGWHYQMGVHIGKYADLYGEHFSQHLLDTTGPNPYPMENLIGLKVYLYRRER